MRDAISTERCARNHRRAPLWLNERSSLFRHNPDRSTGVGRGSGRDAAGPAGGSAVRSKAAPRQGWRFDRRVWLRCGLFLLLPLALVVGSIWYVTGGQIMSTDDAYVEAEKVGISTDIAGIVQEVNVTENQHVTAGQVLYRLDPRQFQIALDNAKANLAEIALSIEAMKQDYRRMLSDVAAQQAQVDLDQTNYDRKSNVLRSGTVSQSVFDQAQATLRHRQEQARIAASAGADAVGAGLSGNADIAVTQHPQYLQAQGAGGRGATAARSYRGRRRRSPGWSPTSRRSLPANISPHRRRRFIWSIPITFGSRPTRRRPNSPMCGPVSR